MLTIKSTLDDPQPLSFELRTSLPRNPALDKLVEDVRHVLEAVCGVFDSLALCAVERCPDSTTDSGVCEGEGYLDVSPTGNIIVGKTSNNNDPSTF